MAWERLSSRRRATFLRPACPRWVLAPGEGGEMQPTYQGDVSGGRGGTHVQAGLSHRAAAVQGPGEGSHRAGGRRCADHQSQTSRRAAPTLQAIGGPGDQSSASSKLGTEACGRPGSRPSAGITDRGRRERLSSPCAPLCAPTPSCPRRRRAKTPPRLHEQQTAKPQLLGPGRSAERSCSWPLALCRPTPPSPAWQARSQEPPAAPSLSLCCPCWLAGH